MAAAVAAGELDARARLEAVRGMLRDAERVLAALANTRASASTLASAAAEGALAELYMSALHTLRSGVSCCACLSCAVASAAAAPGTCCSSNSTASPPSPSSATAPRIHAHSMAHSAASTTVPGRVRRHTAAVADEQVAPDTLRVVDWQVLDLLGEDAADLNVNKTTLEELVRRTAPSFHAAVRAWCACDWVGDGSGVAPPEVAYLEAQPLGMQARNVKTKTLSHVFQALLLAEGVPVHFVSPKKKLLGMLEGGTYADNKKYAVASAGRVLESCGLPEWAAWFEALDGKRDDLADALLQGYYAAKEALVEAAKPPKKPRRKRAAEAADGKPPPRKRARKAPSAHAVAQAAAALDLSESTALGLVAEPAALDLVAESAALDLSVPLVDLAEAAHDLPAATAANTE